MGILKRIILPYILMGVWERCYQELNHQQSNVFVQSLNNRRNGAKRRSKMKDFVQQAIRTEAPITPEVLERWKDVCRPMHAAIGLCTETGELQDGFKKHIYYGKPLDKVNIKEELGDKLWYIALMCDWLGCTVEELQQMVIAKLRKRYPEKFTEYDAQNRDLDGERKILEKGE